MVDFLMSTRNPRSHCDLDTSVLSGHSAVPETSAEEKARHFRGWEAMHALTRVLAMQSAVSFESCQGERQTLPIMRNQERNRASVEMRDSSI